MKYAGLIKNDLSAAPGTCVTFFTQGCPHRCRGCHNPESWDFDGGLEFSPDVIKEITESISANGIERTFCIMGGEPLCQENLFLTTLIIKEVRAVYPNIKIYLWTGYTIEELKRKENQRVEYILNNIDCLIDGPFIQQEKDTTLQMRGSRNQRIIYLTRE